MHGVKLRAVGGAEKRRFAFHDAFPRLLQFLPSVTTNL